jgi:4-hydroxybenzoate polyprenyltransferase
MLALFYGVAVVLIGISGVLAGAGAVVALGLLAFAGHLAWQIVRLNVDDPDDCLRIFKSNRDGGLILFFGMLADAYLRAA